MAKYRSKLLLFLTVMSSIQVINGKTLPLEQRQNASPTEERAQRLSDQLMSVLQNPSSNPALQLKWTKIIEILKPLLECIDSANFTSPPPNVKRQDYTAQEPALKQKFDNAKELRPALIEKLDKVPNKVTVHPRARFTGPWIEIEIDNYYSSRVPGLRIRIVSNSPYPNLSFEYIQGWSPMQTVTTFRFDSSTGQLEIEGAGLSQSLPNIRDKLTELNNAVSALLKST